MVLECKDGVMGWVCGHCGCMMQLRAVTIYPLATTKILQGLGVNLHGLGCMGHHDLFMGDCADSYESAIRGFCGGGIA